MNRRTAVFLASSIVAAVSLNAGLLIPERSEAADPRKAPVVKGVTRMGASYAGSVQHVDGATKLTFAYVPQAQTITVLVTNVSTTKILKPLTHEFTGTDPKAGKLRLQEVQDNFGNKYTVKAITPALNPKLDAGIYPGKSREFKIVFLGEPVAVAKSMTLSGAPNLFGNAQEFVSSIPLRRSGFGFGTPTDQVESGK